MGKSRSVLLSEIYGGGDMTVCIGRLLSLAKFEMVNAHTQLTVEGEPLSITFLSLMDISDLRLNLFELTLISSHALSHRRPCSLCLLTLNGSQLPPDTISVGGPLDAASMCLLVLVSPEGLTTFPYRHLLVSSNQTLWPSTEHFPCLSLMHASTSLGLVRGFESDSGRSLHQQPTLSYPITSIRIRRDKPK
ncbi:hypothetical protein VNO77_03460 [Canavalia gladiata]|uniref:Uncharacterized protein n=1 Tax=Canavalia gladiata TaxID=3824 RepID=A0AAN9N166_CANGL